MRALLRRVRASHPVRAAVHYGAHRGTVLAGGLAYVALFSLVSSLVVGFTVVGLVVGQDFALRDRVVDAIDAQVPNLLRTAQDPDGVVAVRQLFRRDLLSTTGAVFFVTALVSGLSWVDALREGVRAVLGLPQQALGFLERRLKDFAGLLTFGLLVLASAVLSVGVSAAAGWLLRLAGLDGGPLGSALLRAAGVAVVLVVDAALFVVVLRGLSGVRLPRRELRAAALVGAAGLGALKLSGGLLLQAVTSSSNPVVATSAVLAGLLVWMNLVSRVVLFSAAWAATDPDVAAALTAREGTPVLGPPVGPVAAVGSAVLSGGLGARRAPRRTTLAAGVVLGALALAGAQVVLAAARGVTGVTGLQRRRAPRAAGGHDGAGR